MSKWRALGAVGTAAVLGLGPATAALADPLLGVELLENGYTPYIATSSSDPLVVTPSFGTFNVNAEVNTLVTQPLSIDLSSTNVSTNTAGTLTIVASATGLTSPIGLTGFLTQFSGSFTNAGTSASVKTYISNSNTMFGTDTLLDTASANGTPFASTGSGGTTTMDPFAITLVETLTTNGQTVFSIDANAAAAPEIDPRTGLAAVALLLGVLGLVGERHRGPAAFA